MMLPENQQTGQAARGARRGGGVRAIALVIALAWAWAWALAWGTAPARAAPDFQISEMHLQYGTLKNPGFAGGGSFDAFIVTAVHSSKWGPADIFFFADLQNKGAVNGQIGHDTDFYGEIYVGLSLVQLAGRETVHGPLKDFGLRMGFNYGADPKLKKYLPGIRMSFEVPGFRFLNLDVMAILDASSGLSAGGAPKESDGWNLDVSYSTVAFEIGGASFLFNGHVEYINARRNELGQPVSWWILGQPQFRFDLGKAISNVPNQLYVGIEWQFWINKQGDGSTNENAVQALIAWRF